jgi:aldehyde dehydrogenase (NAD+)
MGNAATMFVPSSNAVAAAALCEALGTCDLPGGVVNVLTGDLQELVGAADKHDDIDAVWMARGALPEAVETAVEVASARMLKRVFLVDRAARAAGPTELARLSEVQTVWMSA